MSRVKFFYAHGTAYLFRWYGVPLSLNIGGGTEGGIGAAQPAYDQQYFVPGLGGATHFWNGSVPADPFPDMLDSSVWDVVRIQYPASFFPLGLSVQAGADEVIGLINAMPAGTPFALGGYSQGAAVMASVVDEMQTGSLTSRYSDFLGGVTFGNPRRKTDWRGPVGGTWSGAMDVPGSNTGGHGSFPTTGLWPRMTDPPDTWVDFAAPGDIFTSVGNSSAGVGWTACNDVALDLSQSHLLTYLLTGLLDDIATGFNYFFIENGSGGPINYFLDAISEPRSYSGYGHTIYPFLPPPNTDGSYPVTSAVVDGQTYLIPAADTCYQVALKYLSGLAGEWATTPIVVPEPAPSLAPWSTEFIPAGSPSLSAGWSTTL